MWVEAETESIFLISLVVFELLTISCDNLDPWEIDPFFKNISYNFQNTWNIEKTFIYLESVFNSLLNGSGTGWILGKYFGQILKTITGFRVGKFSNCKKSWKSDLYNKLW